MSKIRNIVGVTGGRTPILKIVRLQFKINEHEVEFPVHVIHQLLPDIILGRDFLTHFNCVIDYSDRTLVCKPTQ